jgi:hypothetical protein
MTRDEPTRLADYRPDAWQHLIRMCPDHERACGPFCVTLWAAPLDAADEDRMSEKTSINPSNPHHVGLWRVREAPYHYKDLGGRWRALKAKIRVIQAVAGGAQR